MPSPTGPEILDFRPAMRQTMLITRKSLETDGKVSRVEIELEAGQGGPPAHIHPGQREVYTVDSGDLVVTVDGESRVITAGESIEVTPGSVHSFANRSDELVRFSAEHLPALRFEEYIRLWQLRPNRRLSSRGIFERSVDGLDYDVALPPAEQFSVLECPTLVLHGADDLNVPRPTRRPGSASE